MSEENTQDIIQEYFEELSPEIDARLQDNWEGVLDDVLAKKRVPESLDEYIHEEVFLTLSELQTLEQLKDELSQREELTTDQINTIQETVQNFLSGKIEQTKSESLSSEDILPSHESRIPTPEEASQQTQTPKNIPTNEDSEPLDMWEKYEQRHTKQETNDLGLGEVHPEREHILREIENPTKKQQPTNAREEARKALAGEKYVPQAPGQIREERQQTQTPDYSSEGQEEILGKRSNDPYRELPE